MTRHRNELRSAYWLRVSCGSTDWSIGSPIMGYNKPYQPIEPQPADQLGRTLSLDIGVFLAYRVARLLQHSGEPLCGIPFWWLVHWHLQRR